MRLLCHYVYTADCAAHSPAGIWAKIGFDRPGKGKSRELAGGAALFVSGLLTAATPLWAAHNPYIQRVITQPTIY